MALEVIILAAGRGVRMHSSKLKVLQKLAGEPLLTHVLKVATSLQPVKIHVVFNAEMMGDLDQFSEYAIDWVEQKERLGTADAVACALPSIENNSKILVLYGDVPLITRETLLKLVDVGCSNALTLLTAEVTQPFGLGRIIRDLKGNLVAIREEKDASEEERKLQEINSGILLTNKEILLRYLPLITNHNAQKEFYLTDIVGLLVHDHQEVAVFKTLNEAEVMGINDREQLAVAERALQLQRAKQLMQNGLTLVDPNRFDLNGELKAASDVTIYPNVLFEGKVSIGKNSVIYSNNVIKNSVIGEDVVIKENCVIEGVVISDRCVIGPFARLRPGTELATDVHIGNFVEVKNSRINEGSKANHLTYLGDSEIGRKVNIGAGTITCNYDGKTKHRTKIGDTAFIGSNVALVAPIEVGDGALIGAGSTITEDAAAHKITVSRAPAQVFEKNI